MTNVDQFESVFRSAAKERLRFERVSINSVLVVTDLDETAAYEWSGRLREFLSVLDDGRDAPAWEVITGDQFSRVPQLLELVKQHAPDLVIIHRHLHRDDWDQPWTLGEYVEVLTQSTDRPVLVLPRPQAKREAVHAMRDTSTVMAMTDHLTGDRRLVNVAVRFTEPNGTLFLTHIEDDAAFARYMQAIGKIPSIDTDDAQQSLQKQLLKEPTDYIHSCRDVLQEHDVRVHIEPVVTMGHRLSTCRALIDEHEVDLLVLNTKEEDQSAMHGLAYPLAVELRHIPLLML